MKEIRLTRGAVALVDDGDFAHVSRLRWHANKNHRTSYAVCVFRENGKQREQTMHRFLLNPPKGMEVDHINGNGLDNRRANLRLATHSQNICNQKLRNSNVSGYKGVTWFERYQRWHTQVDGKHVGYYDTPEEAAYAYDVEATRRYGLFAKTNLMLGILSEETAKRIREQEKNAPRPAGVRHNNTSGYTGVGWRKSAKRWIAYITVDQKFIFLGYYDTPEEAALAYNRAATKYRGEFAVLNEVPDNEQS